MKISAKNRLLIGQAISHVGNWISIITIPWLIAESASSADQSAMWVSQIDVAKSTVTLLFSACIMPVVILRFSSKSILAISGLCSAVVMLGFAAIGDQIPLPLKFLTIFMCAKTIFDTAAQPAIGALAKEIVPEENERLNLNRLFTMIWSIIRIIVTLSAGWLLLNLGAPTLFYIDSITYLALFFVILTLPKSQEALSSKSISFLKAMSVGFENLKKEKEIRRVFILSTTQWYCGTLIFFSLIPTYVKFDMSLDVRWLGWL